MLTSRISILFKNLSQLTLLTSVAIALSSCVAVNPNELNYKPLTNSDVQAWTHEIKLSKSHVTTIAIAPVFNHTNNKYVNAAIQAWLAARLTDLGYYVLPPLITNSYYQANPKLQTTFSNNYGHDLEFKTLHANALVYVNIDKFGQEFELLNSFERIQLQIKIIDN